MEERLLGGERERVRGEEGEEKREPITKDRQEEERMREGIRKGKRNRGER